MSEAASESEGNMSFRTRAEHARIFWSSTLAVELRKAHHVRADSNWSSRVSERAPPRSPRPGHGVFGSARRKPPPDVETYRADTERFGADADTHDHLCG